MANPITVGTTAIVAIHRNGNRNAVRFQNVGATTLFFSRGNSIPSSTNFEFSLAPSTTEPNEAHTRTESVTRFNVVSSAASGSLAIFETINKETF